MNTTSVNPQVRRSERIAIKRWSSHFAKKNLYADNYIIGITITLYVNDVLYENRKEFPRGMKNLITLKCAHATRLYEFLISCPLYIKENSKFMRLSIEKAHTFLEDPKLQDVSNRWMRELRDALHEFLEMCDYIHLCK